jgi:superfamily II DNA or RNA helicase
VTATIQLRDYQQDAHDAVIREYLAGTRRTLIVLPTGAGKTIVFGSIIAKAIAEGCWSLVLAHTEELVDQAARTLRTLLPNVSVGIVRAHHDEHDAQVIVATVQTLRNPVRLAQCGHFHQIVIDEVHHAVARTYQDILETLGAYDHASVFPFVLGVTATADRADGQGLGHVFESICYETGIFDLIQRGYLSDIRAKRIMLDVNLDRVQTRGGDFVDSALGEAMTDAGAPAHIAAAIRDHAPGRRTIVFTPTVAMAEQTAAAVNAIGIPAKSVSGETPKVERQQIIDDVRSGALQVITNCMVLTEGFDAPILDCAVMARPTSSRSLYQQSAGRVLRPYIGKADALILDMVGVTTRHAVQSAAGLIDALPAGSVIDEGETATEAVSRIAAEEAMLETSGATLIAIDVDIFHRSDLNWVAGSNSGFMLTGANNAFVIRPRAGADSCDVFRLEQVGFSYRAIRVAEDVDLAMAQALAEDGARRTGLDAMTIRAQAWRQDPVTDGQMRKLWAIGVRSQKVRNGITTKGEASDLIATVMADQAIAAHDLIVVPERRGVAA